MTHGSHSSHDSWPLAPTPLQSSVIRNHIHRFRGLLAELPQHRRHLTAMVAGVVHDVLEHLPERRHPGLAAEQLVLADARQAFLAELVEKRAHVFLIVGPGAANRGDVRERLAGQQRRRRLPPPPRVPRPFGGVGMNDRFTNGLEAAPEVAVELLGGQRVERVEQPIPRPVVVVEQRPEILKIHRTTRASKRRSRRGNSRSRYALPPSKSGGCLPARIPPPEPSPYSLLSASATSIPSTTSPNGTNP